MKMAGHLTTLHEEPTRAWILIGDRASWPTPERLTQLRADADRGTFTNLWTGPRQGATGDLALFYFTAPIKAVCFVARLAKDAFWDEEIAVASEARVSRQQWWVTTTPPLRVAPISFLELQDAAANPFVLKGRSGKEVPIDVIRRLRFEAWVDGDQQAVSAIVGQEMSDAGGVNS